MLCPLKTDKASGPDDIPPRFLEEFLIPALILESMHLFSLFLRRVTTPTCSAIALLLSLWLLLSFSKLCLTPTSSNTSNLTIFFQIASMASVRQDLQGIIFLILLIIGHPLLGTLENHSLLLLVSLRHLTETGIKLCQPNFQLTALLLPFVNSFLAFYLITLHMLLVTAHASFLASSGVSQGSVLSPSLLLLFISDLLHASVSDVCSFANDSTLHKSSSFHSQPSPNAYS